MTRFLVLLTLGLLTVAEVGAVLLLVDSVGIGWTLMLMAADLLLGVLVLRWGAVSPGQERGWRVAAGLIIMVPGFVLDLVGLFLLVPGPRNAMAARASRSTEEALRRRGLSVVTVTDAQGKPQRRVFEGDVISGEVIQEEHEPLRTDADAPDRASDAGQGNARPGRDVIRGDVVRDE